MNQIQVGLGDRSYPIWIGHRTLDNLASALKQVSFPEKIAIVTNPLVGDLYCEQIAESLTAAGHKICVIRLPDGEEYKNLDTLQNIYDVLIERRFDRFSGLIALGGGVIGDMTGFAAATYLRGVPFVQIPTTLLSQVDSSVGGKTGVNHPQGKNLIGAFYQPQHVHIDVDVLTSLPMREFAAGVAEVIKYGIICDQEFFLWLEDNKELLKALDPDALVYTTMKSCQIKADVVENDEKEQGLRAILNFGHTFGHAVETLSGYGVIKHGEAVSIGMVLAARMAQSRGLCTLSDVERIRDLLSFFNLPVTPPDFSVAEYLSVMQRDKKVKAGAVRFVLNHGIGECDLYSISDIESALNELLT
ncbi:MAG: 3-dehydroquinate synthase [Desulfuromonadales bacterium]|nr:3-dehydroquinate synthase [Desulfuromonadales bacterium]